MPNPAVNLHPLRMPGATLVSRLKAYDTLAPDGQFGGTPHLHTLCTEMYFVISGRGAVEMIDATGFSRVEMEPLSALIFSPGTIHRLINPDRNMELLVIMQNSGLPERGDNVVSLVPEIMRDEKRFKEAMTIASLADAYHRRDLGVQGFVQLRKTFEQSADAGRAALTEFYELAAARTAGLRAQWRQVVTDGSLGEAERSLARLAALTQGDISHLQEAQHHEIHAAPFSKNGFCGHLDRYFDPAMLMLEGTAVK